MPAWVVLYCTRPIPYDVLVQYLHSTCTVLVRYTHTCTYMRLLRTDLGIRLPDRHRFSAEWPADAGA